MSDRFRMKNMQFYGYHGIFTAEKEMGQIIEVDVELVCDLAAAAKNDDPEMAFNPVDIYTVCKDIVEGKDFNLLEAIAEAIAAELHSMYDLEEVRVNVRKPGVPAGGIVGSLEVEICRRPQ
ncbi:MAG: dihydroneopterin aldolase [Bacillota bacterium]|nr:dihydroneopterin aldolase [Bacillota bacterium]NLU55234.1 dihydroneopterin aldolase [Bacillota bacterium]HOA91640.1 dihydroneopterin aldolase [Bacillota bacterium]HOL12943.1 dihydroneopterin aldolase [Bacillota bacterium]HOP53790.1 dihydroneopterin aldolase [Bacillota bacterium]